MNDFLKLTAKIERYDNHYMAYIDSIKGMVETADTPENAVKELIISLKVKLAYDLGIDLEVLKESTIEELKHYQIETIDINSEGYAEKEINLMTQVC